MLRDALKLSIFNWSAVNPIRYVAGSLYLIAETEHRDEPGGGGSLVYLSNDRREANVAKFSLQSNDL